MILNAHVSYPFSHTYVLKLHRDAAAGNGQIVGRLEHVASGHQFHFSSKDELIICLARAAALQSGQPESES